MPKLGTKCASNVCYKARIEASKFNDSLKSREGASSILGIDRNRLVKIEMDMIAPYPDEMILMSEMYNCPELLNYYCSQLCPIGKINEIARIQDSNLSAITVKLCSSLTKSPDLIKTILDIVADGKISEEEKPVLKNILKVLNDLEKPAQELKLWAKKNLKDGE